MAKKTAKNTEAAMRTLIIDNGSQYLKKIEEHVNTAASEKNIDKHEVVRLSPSEVQDMYNKDKQFLNRFNYVISSGSSKYSKADTEFHNDLKEKLSDSDSTFLGVCHGAQQYATSHGAELKKGEYMHQGKRESRVVKYHDSLKGIHNEGKISQYGHHKWFVPNNNKASNLEIIAEGETKSGEKFVEMYKVKGKEHYGVQFHPEKGDGKVIKNLFEQAYRRNMKDNSVKEYKNAA
ncbi:hypothetical protein GF323_03690 [Candidatus Woesearchaeota archaeon]|nr:hypothetical protein [Candidatus Woesearchaeota archaeon]